MFEAGLRRFLGQGSSSLALVILIFLFMFLAFLLLLQSVASQAGNLGAVYSGSPTFVYLTCTPDTAHTINVNWRTSENYVGEVRYDNVSHDGDPSVYRHITEGTGGLTTPQLEGYIHHVELTGLKPDTIYYFLCGSSDYGWSDEQSFRTAPDQSTSFSFVQGGDSRDDNRYNYHTYWPSARDDISKKMAEHNPSFVLFGGDYLWSSQSPGPGYAENDTWDNWLAAIFKYWRTSDNRLIPLIPVIGNHEVVYPEPSDYNPGTDANNYYTVFDVPGRWYALSWGPDLRIIVLDSEVLDSNSSTWQRQLQWLESELENSENYRLKVVAFHRPIVSSVNWDWDGRLEDWGYLFTKYGVNVVFQCHYHNYERSYPIDSDPPPGGVAPPGQGPVYIVSGGWGAPLYSGGPRDYTAYGPDSRYHFLLVDVFENGLLHPQAIDQYGTVFDEFSLYGGVSLNVSTSPGENHALPGQALGYTIIVKNIGNVADNYNLYAEDSRGWGLILADNLLENVQPGEEKATTLTVTIPENAEVCTEDDITVTVTSQENAQVSDSTSCIAHAGEVFTHQLAATWAMISFPVVSKGDTPDNIFAGQTYSIWEWDPTTGGYVKPPSNQLVELGVGYWVRINQNGAVSTCGISVENFEISQAEDSWNLIGFPIATENDTPANLLENATYYSMWKWDAVAGGYAKPPDDQPVELGLGYWLKTDLSSVGVPY